MKKFCQWLLSPHKRMLIKIIPHHAEAVYKCEFSHLHLALAGFCAILLSLGLLIAHVADVRAAEAHVRALQIVEAAQKQQLNAFSRQTKTLWQRLSRLQRDNQEMQTLTKVIVPAKPAGHPQHKVVKNSNGQQIGLVHGGHTFAIATHVASQPTFGAKVMAWLHSVTHLDGLGFAAEASELSSLDAAVDEASLESNDLKTQIRAAARAKIEARLARERYLAAIPSIWPTLGYVSSGFGYRSYPDAEFHSGLDIVNDYGAPVYATATGVVTESDWDGGYGYKIVIDHGNGLVTMYAHNSRLLVSTGEAVHKGEQIALVGATGFATGPHVHYQVELWGKPIDPTPYLSGNGKIVAMDH
ncbi:MAG TPA: M23 family metallopeptidase [Candidatus Eremiobacteraceae bacterium]|nr:M23 family metallopeptidase [Candidatus Eremiobacteraceae bacterium]